MDSEKTKNNFEMSTHRWIEIIKFHCSKYCWKGTQVAKRYVHCVLISQVGIHIGSFYCNNSWLRRIEKHRQIQECFVKWSAETGAVSASKFGPSKKKRNNVVLTNRYQILTVSADRKLSSQIKWNKFNENVKKNLSITVKTQDLGNISKRPIHIKTK